MGGEKIGLVKETLHLLLEFLSEQDRLCLITFDSVVERLTALKRVTKENIDNIFSKNIEVLNGRGSTKIPLGMNEAMNVLSSRRYINPVTSVFLLTDGQDDCGSMDAFR